MICSIRFADEKEIDQIHAIEQSSGGGWNRKDFESEFKNSSSKTLLCETDGHIRGFAIIRIISREIHIHKICVTPRSRKLGIGTSLLEYIKTGFSCRRIILEVSEKNTAAIALYNSAGFLKTGLRKNYYPGDNAILMDLENHEDKYSQIH